MFSRDVRVTLCVMFVCVLVMPGIMARNDGADPLACDDMTPQHSTTAQTGPSNYAIDLSSTTYTPGQQITVTIRGMSGNAFMGFLAQGRSTEALSDGPAHIGTFIVAGTTMKTIDCTSSQDTVTHTSNAAKMSQTFIWVAPASNLGSVVIRVTFVQSFSMFWVGEASHLIVPAPRKMGNDDDKDDKDDKDDDDDSMRKRSMRRYSSRSAKGSESSCGCPASTYCCVDHVAFGYALTENATASTTGLTLKYQTRLASNVGHAYSKATGVFSAPASGLYNFQLTAYLDAATMDGAKATACLKHNGVATACVTGSQMGGMVHTSVSQMLPLKLRRGDQVYVVLMPGSCMFGWAHLHSSFSGFLVHPDCDEY